MPPSYTEFLQPCAQSTALQLRQNPRRFHLSCTYKFKSDTLQLRRYMDESCQHSGTYPYSRSLRSREAHHSHTHTAVLCRAMHVFGDSGTIAERVPRPAPTIWTWDVFDHTPHLERASPMPIGRVCRLLNVSTLAPKRLEQRTHTVYPTRAVDGWAGWRVS